MEVKDQRNRDLYDAYTNALKNLGGNAKYISTRNIIKRVIKGQAPRYYISFERAMRCLSQIENGNPEYISNLNTRKMCLEIYEKYKMAKQCDVFGYFRKGQLVEQILETSASEFFIAPATAIEVIFHMTKGKR